MYTLNEFSNIFCIINSIAEVSSSLEKTKILKAHRDNILLKRILQYTYDNVEHNYNVTLQNITCFAKNLLAPEYTDMFELLDDLSFRNITGDKARAACYGFYNKHRADAIGTVFSRILQRDIKAGVSVKTFLKVWPDFMGVTKYCRCSVLSSKTIKKIKFPCYVQLKCDGTYREARVKNGVVSFKTRSGQPCESPVIAEIMKDFPDGYYTGEFTIGSATSPDENRAKGNGLINSDNPPYDKIYFTIWDYITEPEYNGQISQPYWNRLDDLKRIVNKCYDPRVSVVITYDVNDLAEVLTVTNTLMEHGLEGTVIKDKRMTFKNGTSTQQLKVKLKVDADVRLVGFEHGTVGTKYENLNKVLIFTTDDHKVQGKTSGLSDDEVQAISIHPDRYLNKIFTVQFNDLSKAEGHEYYALSHPRFIEFRDDKSETDTLDRVIELRNMAKNFENIR